MTDNLENSNHENVQNVPDEANSVAVDMNEAEGNVSDVETQAENQKEGSCDDNQAEKIVNVLRDLVERKKQYDDEINQKREYLEKNLAEYNTENYLQNEDFKNLYSEAFGALGTNLDTAKFVQLLDKYVDSRIQNHSRKINAQKETENLTDSFNFTNGENPKAEKKLRMQDIPPEELEKYIAKYI